LAIATVPVTFAAVPVVFWLSVAICDVAICPLAFSCGTKFATCAVVKHASCVVVRAETWLLVNVPNCASDNNPEVVNCGTPLAVAAVVS
jgi:hypothetical protein